MPKNEMAKGDSSRIQSTQAQGGKDMSSSGFAARAQSAADTAQNAAQSNNSANTGAGSGAGGQKK
ncbi:hypothetical protein TGAMA5MH_09383 [Trichoderma gamsii]|uniref:SMP domain-containing protein n=1 Tax=Trichoderma gamsii TaxID=398673 RepID=A0A2K0SZF9_9HYPO|nr:hypothetical protein TGAMA5MH_09383 [Trichoderma gamsii]